MIAVDFIQNIYHLRKLHKHKELAKRDLARNGLNIDYRDMVSKSIDRAAVKSHSFLGLQATDFSNVQLNNSVVPVAVSAIGVRSAKRL